MLPRRIPAPIGGELPGMKEMPVEAHSLRIAGSNLSMTRLVDEIGDRPTLLVFLRHLG